MFRRAGQNFQPHLRRLHQQARQAAVSIPRTQRNAATTVALASGITVGSYLWYVNSQKIYNDTDVPASAGHATPPTPQTKLTTVEAKSWDDPNALHSLVWGSNKTETLESYKVLDSNVSLSEGANEREKDIRHPTIATWLDNVALRDMQLHSRHAACVDARGDVYQWGDGFLGPVLEGGAKPVPTLKGKNIVKLQLTEFKVYALSASGKVYVLAADALDQATPVNKLPTNNSWFGTGWLLGNGKNIQYQELAPKENLSWNEKFISIMAGDNHLLALTSKGRAFAHPVNKQANRFGQLGFRSFEVTDPAGAIVGTKSETLKVELLPKTKQDPSAKSIRITPSSDMAADLSNINDSTIHWCTHLFEIPALRGVDVSQIAAGGRTSFARTLTGRVLGWGANEYGQIGLGANVTLDTITVPTEVILWRMVPANTRSKCLSVTAGGDLTSFTVERSNDSTPTTTDLLMCGNGQSGGLGNNTYTSSQGNPVRVKNVSGLLQYSDRTKQLEPITPTEVVISPTGHVLVALDSSAESHGVGGQDLMVWGKNYDYELGNGKKSSLAMPATLDAPDGERLMLMKKKAREVLDLKGKVWKRNVAVAQQVVAGYGNSAVYWKIVG
ncbi:RCC1/BLIP-II [Macrolepiota fuliginosa MF-IS2]|uniref:RCC1/BLIP-II n=1 Tax=Macrolepiota fuliginosa MF-IS2 TaxID=1400762 RepID=A0A9P5XIX2_9AGAR|nr:RCC1/BLIP-II [Macrolepiota fuliginosa MF-IS2]